MTKHVHILGICGTFMGGIAVLARQLGYTVTGSDENVYPPMSTSLASQGITIMPGYAPAHLQPHPDLVLMGNVCKRGNPAVEYVLDQGIPFDSGPGWLSREILANRHVLAVAGTHGKTTTTSLLTWLLSYAGLDPGYLIGGVANNFTGTAALGSVPFFVIEADEYDTAFFDKRPKFLHYHPQTVILNNLEFDHADIYSDLAAIQQQFHYLLRTVPGKGTILYPSHDLVLRDVITRGVWSKVQTFGASDATWQAQLSNESGTHFRVFYQGSCLGEVEWALWGQHNVSNALAAIAAAVRVGVSPQVALQGLQQFKGVKRRLELTGQVNGISVFDDFAHHPTAIEKTLAAVRARVGKRPIFAVLQFGSNTMRSGAHDALQLAKALQSADAVLLLNPVAGSNQLQLICEKMPQGAHIYDSVEDIVQHLKKRLKSDDNVVVMSNKGFDGLQQKLLQALQT